MEIDLEAMKEWEKNRIVVQDILSDKRFLSTVRIPAVGFGMDYEFETMLFDNVDDMNELGCWRWDNKEAAEQGHQNILNELRHEQLTIELSGLGVMK